MEENNHPNERAMPKLLQVSPFHIDPACGCNYIISQEWRPDNWSTVAEQNQQQRILGYAASIVKHRDF